MLFWLFVITFAICFGIAFFTSSMYKQKKQIVEDAYRVYDKYNWTNDINKCNQARKEYNDKEYSFEKWKRSRIGKFCTLFGDSDQMTSCIFFGLTCFLGIAIAGMLMGICGANIDTPKEEARLRAAREVLVYELESDIYNDFGDDVVGKKELFTQIREFNTELAEYKAYSNNFWIGIFYPDATKNIDPILLS